jgi:hypothetical protein
MELHHYSPIRLLDVVRVTFIVLVKSQESQPPAAGNSQDPVVSTCDAARDVKVICCLMHFHFRRERCEASHERTRQS